MGSRRSLAIGCALPLALVSALASTQGGAPHDSAKAYLARTFTLSRSDLDRLDAGRVVTRTLDTSNAREVATLGLVRIATTPKQYVERLSDIATFKRTEDILQIGTFGDPPQPGDLAALTLDEGDVRRLQGCRVDACGVRIDGEAIAEFGRAVNWRAPDAAAQATSLMRRLLVDYVARYRERGAPALMKYANDDRRLDVGKEFAALFEGDPVEWRDLHDLRRHVLEYPHDRLSATDVIYWSKERVHKRGVISITHLSIVPRPDGALVPFAIASKQIYAAHYFDASLGLTLLVPDRSSSSAATYVVYVNRSRIDLFDGMFGGVARRIVSGRARSLVGTQLTRLQRTLASQK